MSSRQVLLHILRLSMALILAGWVCIWILKPTQRWKRSWHDAEHWANSTFLKDSGLNVVVFCFPILAVATIGYIYLHLVAEEEKSRRRTIVAASFSNPIIVNSPIGFLTGGELLSATLLMLFLVWTYYSNISSDLRTLKPLKSLQLNRLQLKLYSIGVRFGSLSDACLLLLLLLVLRGMALFRILGVQFEVSVRYHVWIGNLMILFSALHSTIIMAVWGANDQLLRELTKWQRTGRVNLAGGVGFAAGLIIWITSLPQMRRRNFEVFYLVHHLYIVFILFFLLHAGDRHFYLVFPGVLLFALDKILRIIQSKTATQLSSARILPCKAVELTFRKHSAVTYTPTSIVFLEIPSVSRFQWHPFSIISSCKADDETLSLLVKCQGQWTNSLYDLIDSMADTSHNNGLSVSIEGPYGPAATFAYQQYDRLILVAGGSGITPFLSILQDISSRKDTTNTYPRKIQLIYVVKRLQDLNMLTPISSLLLNRSAALSNLRLRVFITEEDRDDAATALEILHGISEGKHAKIVTFGATSSVDVLPMQEGLLWKATITGSSSLVFLVSLVFSVHNFIHPDKTMSETKNPSWINDTMVLCSFIVATICTTMATLLLRRRRTVKDTQAVHQKFSPIAEMHLAKQSSTLEEHKINFGRRPNLIDVIAELEREEGESKVGVFVCGPYSMQKSVASFCIANSQTKLTGAGKKHNCSFIFEPINFSL